jgi:hypothetical protein
MPASPNEPRLEEQLNELRVKAEDIRTLWDTALLLDGEADVDGLASDAEEAHRGSAP